MQEELSVRIKIPGKSSVGADPTANPGLYILPLLRNGHVVVGKVTGANKSNRLTLKINSDSIDCDIIGRKKYKESGWCNYQVKSINAVHINEGFELYYDMILSPSGKKASAVSSDPAFISIRNFNSMHAEAVEIIRENVKAVYSNTVSMLENPGMITLVGNTRLTSFKLMSIINHNLFSLQGIVLVDPIRMEYLRRILIPDDDLKTEQSDDYGHITECMGLYAEIGKAHSDYLNSNIFLQPYIRQGKWIFICPENIEYFSKIFNSHFYDKYNDLLGKKYSGTAYLGGLLCEPVSRFVYKKVILHELGHLVFSTSYTTTDRQIFDETRANWFSSIFMNKIELLMLRLFTAVQPYRYQKLMPIPDIDFSLWKYEVSDIVDRFIDYYQDVESLFFCNQDKQANSQLIFEYRYEY